MARSQQTFNKKENEKKKHKKRLDKVKKKEERLASGDKSKSFEDMFAYVDEHGNLSSTPPEPGTKKEEINVEDIQIGTPKKEELDAVDSLRTGTITFFNDSKGYGFIRDHDTKESIFVHINGIIDQVKEGNKVTFETVKGTKGLNAVDVKLAP